MPRPAHGRLGDVGRNICKHHIFCRSDARPSFRTWHKAWKTKRLARNPNVRVAPATLRGEPTGPAFSAEAKLLQGREAATAASALACRHPFLQRLLVPLTHRLMRYRTMHYELVWDQARSEADPEL
jgi:PPOX class probable F420-dependent enzyme